MRKGSIMLEGLIHKDNCFVLVFLLGGVLQFIIAIIKRRDYVQVTGEITSYDQNSQLHYIPVVQFKADGVDHTIQLNRGFKRKLAEEGQLIEIYYKPDNPAKVQLVGDRRDIVYASILMLLGIMSIFFLMIE